MQLGEMERAEALKREAKGEKSFRDSCISFAKSALKLRSTDAKRQQRVDACHF